MSRCHGNLALVAVFTRVVGGVVKTDSVGARLDQGGPSAGASPLDRLPGRRVDGEEVVAVDGHSSEAVAGRAH